jgi:uridine phosphorylase
MQKRCTFTSLKEEKMKTLQESELVLNPDGSVYHLKLKPEHIADTVIVVGDQNRVETISKHFDNIEYSISNREFLTHTGTLNKKRITVLSTGIGTDNIDIVVNELDAAVNINLETRQLNPQHRSLNIIRLGTSGALQADIPVDSFVVSTHGIGCDGLLNFYEFDESILDKRMMDAFISYTGWGKNLPRPYIVKVSDKLITLLGEGLYKGVTATASGFYGPQGRVLRIPLAMPRLNEKIESFNFEGHRISNFEMETSALYGLCAILGHNALTICDIIANRVIKQFSKDYKQSVEKLIMLVLERLTK